MVLSWKLDRVITSLDCILFCKQPMPINDFGWVYTHHTPLVQNDRLDLELLALGRYSISQEICTQFLLCCALLWLYIDWFTHICSRHAHVTSNDCPSASKATLMDMDKYFMWIYYERLRNHNKAKHNKTVFIFIGIYCISTIPCCVEVKRVHPQPVGTSYR